MVCGREIVRQSGIRATVPGVVEADPETPEDVAEELVMPPFVDREILVCGGDRIDFELPHGHRCESLGLDEATGRHSPFAGETGTGGGDHEQAVRIRRGDGCDGPGVEVIRVPVRGKKQIDVAEFSDFDRRFHQPEVGEARPPVLLCEAIRKVRIYQNSQSGPFEKKACLSEPPKREPLVRSPATERRRRIVHGSKNRSL